MKNYIGISRDHSGSMSGLAESARRDFNSNIESIKKATIENNQDTIVSVMKCGIGRPGRNEFEVVNSNVTVLNPISSYVANGSSTPLYDSVGELISVFERLPDAKDETVSFLIMCITDGEDNASRVWSGPALAQKIRQLQATDRWTFVFRVPRGYKRNIVQLGVPEYNVIEWDQTYSGIEQQMQATNVGIQNFYTERSLGKKSVQTFYADMSKVTTSQVASSLTDISAEVSLWPVLSQEDGEQIRIFCERRLGKNPMLKGGAFYQLTKLEKKVQANKLICVRDKKTQLIYSGTAARNILGLPHYGDVKLAPGHLNDFDVFIQSTSVNRKLVAGTTVLYWPKVGVGFTEGPSALKK